MHQASLLPSLEVCVSFCDVKTQMNGNASMPARLAPMATILDTLIRGDCRDTCVHTCQDSSATQAHTITHTLIRIGWIVQHFSSASALFDGKLCAGTETGYSNHLRQIGKYVKFI